MSVGELTGENPSGELAEVREESVGTADEGTAFVLLQKRTGKLQSDLRIGAALSSAQKLSANAGLCWQGMKLVGDGFIVDPTEAKAFVAADQARLGLTSQERTSSSDRVGAVSLISLAYRSNRQRSNPVAYQRVLDRVKHFGPEPRILST
jgi:hypothetical protein